MSNKLKGKKLSVPREYKEIEKEVYMKWAQTGALQYEIKIKQDQLNSLNRELMSLNNEGSARKVLDSQKEQAASAAEEVSNVQSN